MATTDSTQPTSRMFSPRDVLRRVANDDIEGSFANVHRARRFEAFARLVDGMLAERPGPIRILDIGGTNAFWATRGWAGRKDVEVVLANLEVEPRLHDNLEPVQGDATDLSAFPDQSFDIVFSNSVIEHLETYERQAAMAREVRRLAPVYWIQTPNFWFPVEPHFLAPAWHWLPVAVRVRLLQRRRWGWRGPAPDAASAEALVREIRLMRGGELKRLFPDGRVDRERIGPLVKSHTVVRA